MTNKECLKEIYKQIEKFEHLQKEYLDLYEFCIKSTVVKTSDLLELNSKFSMELIKAYAILAKYNIDLGDE